MTQIATDLRNTRESAKRIRFEPVGSVTATNVQDAILQVTRLTPTVIPTSVNFAMSPYTPQATDQILEVDTSGGPVTIQMPLSATRTLDLEVKDITGNAGVNAISVQRAESGENIDGLSAYPLNGAYAAAKFGPKTGGYYVHA